MEENPTKQISTPSVAWASSSWCKQQTASNILQIAPIRETSPTESDMNSLQEGSMMIQSVR